jgi:RNA polymerase sigma factor (sigma-70 family)
MDARLRGDSRSDAELAAAAAAGDRGAFAAIYGRYADRLHDFCWSLLRDRGEAVDATRDAFLVAADRLGQLRDPEGLRPWLYAAARGQALRRVRARRRVAPETTVIDLPDGPAGPEQADLRELAWTAAAWLSERDRALLDLHLRHGLDGAELGAAMGIPAGLAGVLLDRLRDQVERSLGALLVARLGARDCPDLARLLAGWDGRFSPLIRTGVAGHVDGCEVCAVRRRAAPGPLALLAAVPPLPAPPALRGRVLGRLQVAGADGAGPPRQGPGPTGPGVPPAAAGRPARARSRRRVVAVAAAVVLAASVGVALGWERDPAVSGPGGAVAGAGTSGPAASLPGGSGATVPTASSTSTSGSTTTATTATTVPAAPGSLAVSPAAVDLGPTRGSVTVTLRNGGDEALSWTAAASAPWLRVAPAGGRLAGGGRVRVAVTADRAGLPEGTADGAVQLAWDGPARRVAVAVDVEHPPRIGQPSASPGRIGVTGCTPDTALVRATVRDESPLASVVLEGGGARVPMTQRAGVWNAELGPVEEPGTVAWRVVAADVRGNSAEASGPPVTVVACAG